MTGCTRALGRRPTHSARRRSLPLVQSSRAATGRRSICEVAGVAPDLGGSQRWTCQSDTDL